MVNGIVFVDSEKNEFSRKDLVLHVADKDGGAHVDPDLDAAFAKLSRANSMGHLYHDGKKWHKMHSPELCAIRQIGHEILKTFVPGYGKTIERRDGGLTIGNMKLGFSKAKPATKTAVKRKIGRNEKCPCGSELKYKKCCGR